MKILFVTIDCLRYDAISEEHMPFLHSKMREGYAFHEYYANAPFTPLSFPSIFTSNYPLETAELGKIHREKSFVEALQEAGYRTMGISNVTWIDGMNGYDKGFGFFRNLNNEVDKGEAYKPAKAVTDALLKRIGKDANQFVWGHYMDAHDPYLLPDGDRELNEIVAKRKADREYVGSMGKERLGQIHELYLKGAKRADKEIKRLWEGLPGDDWVLAVSSDHGEEFGEHGNLAHLSKLYNELVHIPLFFYGKGIEKRDDHELRNSIDLASSFCGLAGVKWHGRGKSVFGEKGHGVVFMQSMHNQKRNPPAKYIYGFGKEERFTVFAAMGGGRKLILDQERGEIAFDLESDPLERKPVRDEGMGERLREHIEGTVNPKYGVKV